MKESDLFVGLTNFLLNGATCDGGWDSEPGLYKETNPLNTSEVLCGLISARQRLRMIVGLPKDFDKAIRKAISYLYSTQLQTGGWATGSAYRNIVATHPKGNTVSTCFALWALILNHDLVLPNEHTHEALEKSLEFLGQCKTESGWYLYSPDLDRPSVVSTAYVFLSFALLFSCQNLSEIITVEKRLKAESCIKDLVDCVCDLAFLDVARSQYISIILIYLAVQYLSKVSVLSKNTLNRIERIYHSAILELTLEQCIKPYSEAQVVREKGKEARDFTHYIPVWILMVYSLCDSKSDIPKYKFQVLNTIFENIDNDYNGVSIGSGNKRTTWATGITLFTLCVYTSNYELINILKQEGINMANNKKVFVVHGRDSEFRRSIFQLLRAVNITPLEWNQVLAETNKATPTTFEVISKGFELSQAILILLTGDDMGQLDTRFIQTADDDTEKNLTPQPRLNVVFEAGLAFGINPNRTILLKKDEVQRRISDISGFNYVEYKGDPSSKNSLIERLKLAGCQVDTSGTDWLTM